jgi:hypothetical protein
MPKIKDLGIKVIPETMQPPGIGGGAGCGCTNFTNCIGCTQNLTVGCDPGPSCLGGTHPCLAPTHPCLPTPHPCVPTQITCAPTCHGCSVHPTCIDTPITCIGCTQLHTPCVPTQCGCTLQHTPCGCTFFHTPITCIGCTQLHTPCFTPTPCHGCTAHPTPCIPTPCITPSPCHGCTLIVSCGACTNPATPICVVPTVGGGGCGAISPVCGGSIIDPGTIVQQGGGLTQEHINTLKDQLQKQIQALDEHAKTIGPKTSAEIDAREKQLNDELASLKTRRKDLEKK